MRYIRIYIFTTIVLFLTACGSSSNNTTPIVEISTVETTTVETPTPLESTTELVRVACVGDSLTNGYKLDESQSYPVQLSTLLGDGWSVGSYGVTNATLLQKGDEHSS